MTKKKIKIDHNFFRELTKLTIPYWRSDEKWTAFLLLFLILFCIFGQIAGSISFNNFHKVFFNALQHSDKAKIINSLFKFSVQMLTYAIFISLSYYFNTLLSIKWRQWLTKAYLQKWLKYQAMRPNVWLENRIDNPDQRISEDIAIFSAMTVELIGKFVYSTLMLISFSIILWGLSKNVNIFSNTKSITMPGYLCYLAYVYAILGNTIMYIIGKSLPDLNYLNQERNADFRFELASMRIKNQPEDLLGKNNKLCNLFNGINQNSLHLLMVKFNLKLFDKFFNFFTYIISLVISIPIYLSKVLSLGTIMQISSAFTSVVSTVSIVSNIFDDLADWQSVIYRLVEFNKEIELFHTSSEASVEGGDPALS